MIDETSISRQLQRPDGGERRAFEHVPRQALRQPFQKCRGCEDMRNTRRNVSGKDHSRSTPMVRKIMDSITVVSLGGTDRVGRTWTPVPYDLIPSVGEVQQGGTHQHVFILPIRTSNTKRVFLRK
jgi:hypothetical protein